MEATLGGCWRSSNGSGDTVAADLHGLLAHACKICARASDLNLGLGADGAADGGDNEPRGHSGGDIVGFLSGAGLSDSVGSQPLARLARSGENSLVDSGVESLGDRRAVQESRGGRNVGEMHFGGCVGFANTLSQGVIY